MATIREIAQRAGVSTATVSYVLNGTRPISEPTAARVREAVRELRYTPNAMAKSLRRGESNTVGVLVEDIRGLPVPPLVAGIGEVLEKRGYRLLLHDLRLMEGLHNHYERIGQYREQINRGIDLLLNAYVDGVIYVGMQDRHIEGVVDPIAKPLVYAYSHAAKEDCFISYSNRQSAEAVMDYLIHNGHRMIGVLAGHPQAYPTQRRLLGIRRRMAKAGLALAQEYVRYGDWSYESGEQAAKELLLLPERPTAVFAMNDMMAAGCMRALGQAGLRIPWDVSVTGFDDIALARVLEPSLTTVRLPFEDMGIAAGNALLARLNGEEAESQILDCQIIVRESVSRACSSD